MSTSILTGADRLLAGSAAGTQSLEQRESRLVTPTKDLGDAGMRVLIVDDDPDIRLMMNVLFRDEGWETTEAASAREAQELLEENTMVDMIVLDYRMPEVTGLELARDLRDSMPSQPMILCSAYLDPEVEEEAMGLSVPTVDKANLQLLVETIKNQVA
jgi:CheY-like chemotaxis protein